MITISIMEGIKCKGNLFVVRVLCYIKENSKDMSIEIITGPSWTTAAERLCESYISLLAETSPDRILVLVPDFFTSEDLTRRILEKSGDSAIVLPLMLSFESLAEMIINDSDTVIRKIGETVSNAVLRQVIEEQHVAGNLEFYAASVTYPGFVRYVSRFIHVMKESEIDPHVLCEEVSRSAQSEAGFNELCMLYREYHEFLDKNRIYDNSGLFWQAHNLLSTTENLFSERFKKIIVHGFTSFTYIQRSLLKKIYKQVGNLSVSLVYDDSGERGDLFHDSSGLLDFFKSFSGGVELKTGGDELKSLSYIEKYIFSSLPILPDENREDGKSVKLVSSREQHEEIEFITSKIKHLLAGGVSPSQIRVVIPDLSSYVMPVRLHFTRAGIPFQLINREPLRHGRLADFVLKFIELSANRFPRKDFKNLVSTHFIARYVAAVNPDADYKTEDLMTTAVSILEGSTVADGFENWYAYFKKLIEAEEGETGALAESLLSLLKTGWNLYSETSLTRGAENLLAFLEKIIDKDMKSDDETGEMIELRQLTRILEEEVAGIEEYCPSLKVNPLSYIATIINSSLNDTRASFSDSVLVCNPYYFRGLRAEILFFAGLNDSSFPVYRGPDDIPFKSQLIAVNPEYEKRLPPELEIAQDQMILFYNIICSVEREIIFSWTENDTDRASIYIEDIKKCAKNVEVIDAADYKKNDPGKFILNRNDYLRAILQYSEVGEIETQNLSLSTNEIESLVDFQRLAAFENRRLSEEWFDEGDGNLSGALKNGLEPFNSKDYQYSISVFEKFGKCPYQFFVGKVLKIESPMEKEETSTPMDEGSLYHSILREYYTEIREKLKSYDHVTELERAEVRFDPEPLIDRLLDDFEKRGQVLDTPYWNMDKERIRQTVERFINYAEDKLEDAVPEYLEFGFGRAREREETDEKSVQDYFILEAGDEKIKFTGVIDRIDKKISDTDKYLVIDYKSGSSPSYSDVRKGTSFQMLLYLLAAEDYYRKRGVESPTVEAGYMLIKNPKLKTGLKRENGGISYRKKDLQGPFYSFLEQYVRDIRAGIFFPFPAGNSCAYCDFRPLCRFSEKRIADKISLEVKGSTP